MKIQKHHIKHAGFFISLAAILFSAFVLVGSALDVNAVGGETVKVVIKGSDGAGGDLSSSPAGLSCPGACTYEFDADSTVVLNVSEDAGRYLGGWTVVEGYSSATGGIDYCSEGDLNYKGTTCTIDLSQTTNGYYIEIYFSFESSNVRTKTAGTGSGTITSAAGINCSSDCTKSIPKDKSPITLKATAASGSEFKGWAKSSEGGSLCLKYESGGGKGSTPANTRNTSKECVVYTSTYKSDSGKAIAYFEKIKTSDTTESSTKEPATETSDEQETKKTAEEADTAEPKKEVAPIDTNQKTKLNNVEHDPSNDDQKPVFKTQEPIKISGVSEPDSTLKVYVFSNPKEYTVETDSSGYWEIDVEDLEAGEHHVEVAILDASGNETTRATVAQFSVSDQVDEGADANLVYIEEKSSLSMLPLILAVSIGLLGIGYIGWYWWHHKDSLLKHHEKQKELTKKDFKNPEEPKIYEPEGKKE